MACGEELAKYFFFTVTCRESSHINLGRTSKTLKHKKTYMEVQRMFRVHLLVLHISAGFYTVPVQIVNYCASYPSILCSQTVVATLGNINKSSQHHLGAQACCTDMKLSPVRCPTKKWQKTLCRYMRVILLRIKYFLPYGTLHTSN